LSEREREGKEKKGEKGRKRKEKMEDNLLLLDLERVPLSRVSKIEELLRGSALERREYGPRDPSR
jgi:hypothetical protein